VGQRKRSVTERTGGEFGVSVLLQTRACIRTVQEAAMGENEGWEINRGIQDENLTTIMSSVAKFCFGKGEEGRAWEGRGCIVAK